jgi:hypothetical protein
MFQISNACHSQITFAPKQNANETKKFGDNQPRDFKLQQSGKNKNRVILHFLV